MLLYKPVTLLLFFLNRFLEALQNDLANIANNRRHAHDVISVGRPQLEVTQRLVIGARAYKFVLFYCFVIVLPLRWRLDDVNA